MTVKQTEGTAPGEELVSRLAPFRTTCWTFHETILYFVLIPYHTFVQRYIYIQVQQIINLIVIFYVSRGVGYLHM